MNILYCFDDNGYLTFNPNLGLQEKPEKYNVIFDENGNIRSHLKNGIEHLIYEKDFDYDSDAVKIIYAIEFKEKGINGWEKDIDLWK